MTDTDGNYSFENIPAGLYQISEQNNGNFASRNNIFRPGMWLIKVPENKPEFIFDMKPVETAEFIRTSNVNEINGTTVGAYAWLLQDGTDKAIQLPFFRSIICLHDIKPKNGILYIYSAGSQNKTLFYSRVNWDSKTDINNSSVNSESKLPIVSFIAPLIENITYPDMATISGTGPWSDIQYNQSFQWHLYSGLNIAVAQLGSLPSGDWIIKVTASTGKVIENKITVGKYDMSIKIYAQ
jgi:hypothetical protein